MWLCQTFSKVGYNYNFFAFGCALSLECFFEEHNYSYNFEFKNLFLFVLGDPRIIA